MAIIAVLVAIAVPLFVGALDDAKKQAFNANVRALRGTAVAAILSADSTSGWDINTVFPSGKTGEATVKAKVSESGEISDLEIKPATDATVTETTYDKWKAGDEITIGISKIDLKDLKKSGE